MINLNYRFKLNKHFCEAIKKSDFIKKYSEPLTKLYEFKVIMNELIKEKIFHYCILNQNVAELASLQKTSENHKNILGEMIDSYDLNLSSNRSLFLREKMACMNISSVTMSYKAFLDLMKSMHESKEEDVNNIIRDIIENDYQDEVLNKNLVLIRDEWRDSIAPEVLDENSQPIHELALCDKISLEINKKMLNLLI